MKIDIAAVNSEEVLCSEENMVMFTKEMSISKAAPHASGFGRNVPKYNNAAHYARSISATFANMTNGTPTSITVIDRSLERYLVTSIDKRYTGGK